MTRSISLIALSMALLPAPALAEPAAETEAGDAATDQQHLQHDDHEDIVVT